MDTLTTMFTAIGVWFVASLFAFAFLTVIAEVLD